MNKNVTALIVVLGIAAAIYLGIRFYGKQHAEQVVAKQKEAFEESLVADEVYCDACGKVSKLDVAFKDRRTYQICPACGQKKARPIVYWYCQNPSCNKQLVRFANHVWDENGYNPSPQGAPVCPVCRQPRSISPEELTLEDARRIAKETGQPFPPED
jgi:Zn finger protein HypA/HybF involved in hydrogenase expression